MIDLAAVVRFVHLAASTLLVGNFAFFLFIVIPVFKKIRIEDGDWESFDLKSSERIILWSIFALAVSALLSLWIYAININTGAGTLFERLLELSLLTDTRYWRIWLGRLILLIAISVLLFRAKQTRTTFDSSFFLASGFALSACSLATISLSGHAATAEGMALVLQISADALHLVATGIWLGGFLPLALMLRRCSRQGDAVALAVARTATQRFSTLALTCVATVIMTGAYNAWTLVGGFPPLFGTAYGRLLLLKLALLLPLLTLAAVNRQRLKPQMVDANSTQSDLPVLKRLARNIAWEASFGAGILLIVGYMGVTPPARHVQPDWPFSTRWDWSVLEKAPLAWAEVQRGLVWAAIGGIALIVAMARRLRRIMTALIGLGALAYGGRVMTDAVSTDAYPTTYKRPAVAYQAISIANGRQLYDDASCAACHGPAGYGDGPLAEELRPKPADLTAPHANTHTAGDLFWWLSHGVKETSMPGFGQSISEEELWDLINFMRALSSGDRARSLAPVIENESWLVAPDFTYVTRAGEAKTLRDQRGERIVLLVFLGDRSPAERLKQLANALTRLQLLGVEAIIVPAKLDRTAEVPSAGNQADSSPLAKSPFHPPLAKGERVGFDRAEAASSMADSSIAEKLRGLIVNEGIDEITAAYSLFARSFSDEALVTGSRHVEFLIDKQGYIRARWLPAENAAWRNDAALLREVDSLNKEKPRAPAPEDHVH